MQIFITALNVVTTFNRACSKTWERQFVICFAVGKAFLGSKECPTDNIETFVEAIIRRKWKARLAIHNATVNSCLRRNWFAFPVPRRLFHGESPNSEERPLKINFCLNVTTCQEKLPLDTDTMTLEKFRWKLWVPSGIYGNMFLDSMFWGVSWTRAV